MAIVSTNHELAEFVKKDIKATCIKKNDLAENIGLSRQGLDNLLKKKSFSLDDANRILNVIFLSANVEIDLIEDVGLVFIPEKIKKLVDY